jgi:hypothetical protein
MPALIITIADDSLVIKPQRSIVISATNKHIDQCKRDEQFTIKLYSLSAL